LRSQALTSGTSRGGWESETDGSTPMNHPSFSKRLMVFQAGSCLASALVGAWAGSPEQRGEWSWWLSIFSTLAGLSVLGGWLLWRGFEQELASMERSLRKVVSGEFGVRGPRRGWRELMRLRSALDSLFGNVEVLAERARSSGAHLKRMLDALGSASRQQESASGELLAATQRIGSSARQISETADGLIRTVADVDKLANLAAESADRGKSGVQRMEQSIHQIAGASSSIASKLAVLNERAANISSVVTTINKVADQTNLLSFNAAIEAEKAGEFGLGFAVVATEIRRLADQTAIATRDIEKMIREIQTAVSAGVMGMDKFGEEVRRGVEEISQVNLQLTQIIHQVKGLVPRFSEVTGGVQAQMSGAHEISETLILFNTHARQTSRAMEHAGDAVQLLSRAASDLKTGVERFRPAA